MNIVERVCQKYPIDYYMMPHRQAKSVALSFGEEIDFDEQDKILEGLERMGIYPLPTGNLSLTLDVEREGVYALKKKGEILFYFADHTEDISFYEYEPYEAIAWVIFMLSTGEKWLNEYKGQYISCKAFSARQQAAAERFLKCVNAQYENAMSEELIRDTLRELLQYTTCFTERVPQFSARPIPEKVFTQMEEAEEIKKDMETVAAKLFGNVSFEQELEDYYKAVRATDAYQKRISTGVEWLLKKANSIPIMTLGRFFTELQSYINRQNIELAPLDMHRQAVLTFTPEGIKRYFKQADQAYQTYIVARMRQDYLRTVCEQAYQSIGKEISGARRAVAQASGMLQMFCFVQADAEENEDREPLTWKQLLDPKDKDLFVPQASWDVMMLHELQTTFVSRKAPVLWLCADRLKNLADNQMIAASAITKSVPITDEQYVWAVWADQMVD